MAAEDIQALVKQLYDPSFSSQAKAVEKRLQEYQRSPEGWKYANILLGNDVQSLRFFGALTFSIKLKEDGWQLTEEHCGEILITLLSWYIKLSLRDETLIVRQKLCSALVRLFTLFQCPWRKCIKHLAFCCKTHEVLPEQWTPTNDIRDLLTSLDIRMTTSLVVFVKIFAEDLSKIDNDNGQFDYIHKRTKENIEDAATVIGFELARLHLFPSSHVSEVLNCYRSWIIYTSQTLQASDIELESLRNLIVTPLNLISMEEVSEVVLDFFLEVIDEHFDFLNRQTKNMFLSLLAGDRAIDRVRNLEKQEDENTDEVLIKFGRLVLGFGKAIIKTLIENLENPAMDLIHRITRTQTFISFDERLVEDIVDFWDSFNTEAANVSSASHHHAMDYWLRTARDLHNMIKLPVEILGPEVPISAAAATESTMNLGSSSLKQSGNAIPSKFASIRAKVAELVQDSYVIYGVAVLENIINMALSPEAGWTGVEAALTLLSGMSEFIPETSSIREEEQRDLMRLFNSRLMHTVTSSESSVPLRVRKLIVKVIGEHHTFLGSHQLHLLSALDFLFKTMSSNTALNECARAIYRLCDHNRRILNSKWKQLIEISEAHFRSDASTQSSRGCILGANAAVISALTSEMESVEAMRRLLSMLEQRLQLTTAAPSNNTTDSWQLAAEAALAHLAAIGNACQTPDDVPIDIDKTSTNSIWTQEAGRKVQDGIVKLLQLILQGKRDNGRLLEGACDVLKSGYPESSPGPFVFEPQVTVDLLTSTPISNSMLYMAVDTASRFVSSHSSSGTRIDEAVYALIKWVCQILDHFPIPHDDPEVAYSCVEFVSRCISKHLQKIMTLPEQTLIALTNFTLECLEGADPLPKRAAAKYWTTLFKTDNSGNEEHPYDAILLLKAYLTSASPHISKGLIRNFSGLAARSDLDSFFELLKGLITSPSTASQASKWLKAALFDENDTFIPNERVSTTDKERFVSQIVRLRGDRRTKSIVKDFWMACRGMS